MNHTTLRRRIRHRRNLVRIVYRLTRQLEALLDRYITPLQARIDRIKKAAAEVETEVCAGLRETGPLVVGDRLYYPVARVAPDGTSYDELISGNIHIALNREEAEREFRSKAS